jgi:O-antigen/teichoic acid export membrane protein
MAYLGPKQLSATGAFLQSAGAKPLIIGLNAATGILAARALAPAGRGELSAMILCTVPLMLVLVPRFGIEGAALSLLVSTCARFAFVHASFSRFLSLPRPGLLPRRANLAFIHGAVFRGLRSLQPSAAGGEV